MIDINRNLSYTELHTHLYGCISAELLYEIGKSNDSPRWEIYTQLYSKLFGKEVDTLNFFKKYSNIESFKEIYYFDKKGPFLEFQSKFNLIIALCKFDVKEIRQISKTVMEEHALQGIEYAEFRIMYSPFSDESTYYEKTLAACEGLELGERSSGCIGRLVVSLHRDGNFEDQYLWLKKAMVKSPLIQKYLVGLDFCNVEEGFPPNEKKLFFQKVLKDNRENPEYSLSILYHVGESFTDKTHLSTIRWILEASEYGAHRLGHCIALFEDMSPYLNVTRKESTIELKSTYEFLLNRYTKISEFGTLPSLEELHSFFSPLLNSESSASVHYSESFFNLLDVVRKYTISKLEMNQTVIESCPTSNYLIGRIEKYEYLPIKRLIETKLPICISADDPGIFNTTLPREFKICEEMGLNKERLNRIRSSTKEFKSEILSGRKT